MRPCPPRAAAALLAALVFAGPAAAQPPGHTFVVEPLTLRLQSGATTFSSGTFFMGLGVNGTVPAPTSPYTFATVTRPDLSTVSLSQNSPNVFISEFQFTSLNALRTAYPGGTYSAAIGPGGRTMPPVGLPTDYTLPVFPEFTNYPATLTINPQQPFTFTFNAFSTSPLDSALYAVTEIATGNLVASDTLLATDTEFTLPANTLVAHRSYAVTLYFLGFADLAIAFDDPFIHVSQATLASANVISITPVPEPAAGLAVAAAALAGLATRRRKKRRPLSSPPRKETLRSGPGPVS